MNLRYDEMAFMGRLRRDYSSYRSYIGSGNKMSIVNGSGCQDVGKYGTISNVKEECWNKQRLRFIHFVFGPISKLSSVPRDQFFFFVIPI
jgi:hypothetical protein